MQSKYALPQRDLFYPAQFWPHKNHHRIVQALERLKRLHGLGIPVVFCGSPQGAIREGHLRLVESMARCGGVSEQVHQLGYVPEEDMSALYAGAAALVMPTFFGPTNMPVLEAWAFGCPVITSDIRGIREQAGEAALLVDPRSTDELARAVHRLWTDDGLRDELRRKGYQRLAEYGPDDFRRQLRSILEEAADRVRAGDYPSVPALASRASRLNRDESA
ncbi:MAG: glycosyltransferase family 4 protein [Armatimonadetes bacterium]|nr:glycosyltransferase family 4 protein [Armatimonadota bacterium]NCQ32498.1 glycosyltransferase family 4 protein [Armatimonadota bacterium]NDK16898.1 glycosyltransferase family 4 protein [Armatimonadota bacterium]